MPLGSDSGCGIGCCDDHVTAAISARVLSLLLLPLKAGLASLMQGSSLFCQICTEYFERVCLHIVQRNGTIDKFIGDCIMAIWNAPVPQEGHEVDAVAAALTMQKSIHSMHGEWQARDLPMIKFRLGIHTGECLVGNFGCRSHRKGWIVSTCM